jgi:acetyl esterase/lipase
MVESYLDKQIDPEFAHILTQPPAYLGAWSSANIIKKIGRDIIYPPIPVPPDPEVSVTERLIPGPEGAPPIQIRLYGPKIRTGNLPGLLYFHYGGYTIGSPKHEDAMCYRYVKDVGCVIVSPAYRLAPENPAPAAYEDCYAALLWFSSNAEKIGVDPSRIAVTGLSSGGGLTVAVCLMARDRSGPMPIFQMPIAPTIDDRLRTKSSTEFRDPRALNYDSVRKIWNFYLGKGHENRDDISPYAAPAREIDLHGLPPCYCYVGDLDPHRDETIAFVTRLSQAGVPTGFTLYPGGIHAFQLELPEARISRHAIGTSVWSLKHVFYPGA